MGDDDERGPEVADEPTEGVDDLQGDEHVQGGRRLVRHDQLRPAGERRGDGRPLQQAAAQLVRVARHDRVRMRHAQAAQQVLHPLVRLCPGQSAMEFERPAHLGAHPTQRVERTEGILGHEGHARSAQARRAVEASRADQLAVEPDLHPRRCASRGPAARGPPGPAWSCRSPTRRPRPAPRPGPRPGPRRAGSRREPWRRADHRPPGAARWRGPLRSHRYLLAAQPSAFTQARFQSKGAYVASVGRAPTRWP